MKSSIFIILCTEVVIILLTLFQCCDGAVFTEKENINLLIAFKRKKKVMVSFPNHPVDGTAHWWTEKLDTSRS